MKNQIKLLLHNFISYSNIHKIIRYYSQGNGVILMLHRVPLETSLSRFGINCNSSIEITKGYLYSLISYFRQINYDIISLNELYLRINNRTKGRRFVCFTFDDGYIDNYEIAYPIFKECNVPFTIYVTNSFPNNTAILWWYMLQDLVINNSQIKFEYHDQSFIFETENKLEKERSFLQIRSMIIGSIKNDFMALIEAIFYPYNIKYEDYLNLTLSWDQIIELSHDPLVTIGCHTFNHYSLKSLSRFEAENEIFLSKKDLENKIEKDVNHFAYPFGTRNEAGEREFQIVKRSSFKTATTTRQGNIFYKHSSYFECLPRVEISGDKEDLNFLDVQISGAMNFFRRGFRRIVTT